ncbi:MAG: zf-HC2 domain-containing protein, partial [Anaerolineae bacterium]
MNEHLSSQQLSDLAEGLLPPDHQRAVQAHLAACAHCRQTLAQRRALVERLRREVPACLARVTPPPTLCWEHARHRVPRKQRSLTMLRYVRTATTSIAVVGLFVALALGLTILFRQAAPPVPPDGHQVSADETTDETVDDLSGDKEPFEFAPVTLSLQSALPPLLDELPLYRVEPALPEMSAQEVRLWAERLGMGPVRVYRYSTSWSDDVESDQYFYVGLNADWDSLTLFSDGLGFSREDSTRFEDWVGTQVDEATAQAAAQALLERLTPYLITVEGTQTQISFSLALKEIDQPKIGNRLYDIVPQLDGVPLVMQGELQNLVLVGPEGRVNALSFTPLRVSPMEETANPRPAEAALRDLLDGKSEHLSSLDWSAQESPLGHSFFGRPWPHREGDKITVIGNVQWLYGLEGEEDLVLLRNLSSTPHTFILQADNLDLPTQPPVFQ